MALSRFPIFSNLTGKAPSVISYGIEAGDSMAECDHFQYPRRCTIFASPSNETQRCRLCMHKLPRILGFKFRA